MKTKWMVFLILLLCVTGCKGSDTSEQVIVFNKDHTRYLEQYGWSIDRFASETKYAPGTLASFREHLKEMTDKGKLDISAYVNQEVVETGYVLRETTPGYNLITAYILESDGKWIGSYLVFSHETLDENGNYQTDISSTDEMINSSEVAGLHPKKK
ncbi:DUF4830 domain-containing protein [Paenibacillus sp. KQZ6P-2]|uniref:DUF4830 domain-containing protein n=1 Tax=Paenibacillus mangrovi TaxID=2931978 RepID=A0A9X2B3R8_9BACL|nr:DUF4830 domain-containing protein [Paenibacillus mangrovi]MCJ8010862.1 DUF4830 domain-containing protein [Paenibacillus mangrovi]